MGHRPDSTLGKRKIVIGMLTAGMMNKHVVRHFQACESTISSLRANICQLGKNTRLGKGYHGNSDLFKNSSKTAEGCASALTSPIRWCSVHCLHKRVRLNWTTTHCRCILDEIETMLFSRKTSEMARHFFN